MDDEKLVVNLIVSALKTIGVEAITAENGIVAVDQFRSHHAALSLVILDLNMPKMGGKEALVKMRELNTDVPILMSSGFNESDILTDSESAMVSGTLMKPYNGKELIEAVQSAITE